MSEEAIEGQYHEGEEFLPVYRGNKLSTTLVAVSNETLLGRAQLYQAITCDCIELQSVANQTIWVNNIVAHPVTIKATGEQLERTIFVASDGSVYGCVSTVAYECVRRLLSLLGEQAFNAGPLPIIPRLKRARNNPGNMLLIELDIPALAGVQKVSDSLKPDKPPKPDKK